MSTDPAPITLEQSMLLLAKLEMGGLRRPEGHNAPADRSIGLPAGRVLAADVYASAFNRALLSLAEVDAAISAYLDEPDAGQYPKVWPDPGKLIARTAVGRAALAAGSDAELDQAWRRFDVVMRGMLTERPDGTRGPREPRDLHPDPLKAAAMWAGLDAIGGVEGFRNRPVDDVWVVKRWKEAVRAERLRQAQEPRTRRMLVVGTTKMLESGK